MTETKTVPLTTSRAFAGRVKERRKELGWSAKRLAAECARLGHPITESVLANMDAGRRDSVPVDEVDVFSQALRVPSEWLIYGDAGATVRADYDRTMQNVLSQVREVLSTLDPSTPQ